MRETNISRQYIEAVRDKLYTIHNNPSVPKLYDYFEENLGQSMHRLVDDLLRGGLY